MAPPGRYVSRGQRSTEALRCTRSISTLTLSPTASEDAAAPLSYSRMQSIWDNPCTSPETARKKLAARCQLLIHQQPLFATAPIHSTYRQAHRSFSQSPLFECKQQIGSNNGITSGIMPEFTPMSTLRDGQAPLDASAAKR